MLTPAMLWTFIASVLVFVIIPGPNVLFTIGRSIALGRRRGALSVLGTALGSLVLVVAIAAGLGAVIISSAILFTIVKVVGAGYLIYLGIRTIRHRKDGSAGAMRRTAPASWWAALAEGFAVGATNPKSIAFFLAILPQFVDARMGMVPLQLLALGGMVVAVGLASDMLWVLLASAAREWFARSPRRLEGMSAAGGGMMIGLGAILLLWSEKPAAT